MSARPGTTISAAARLLDRGVGCVIVTLGERGILVLNRDTEFRVAALRVKAKDTVGAGDAFNGALACALSEGHNLRQAARFAVAAAGLAVMRRGAQPAMPERRRILASLKKLV